MAKINLDSLKKGTILITKQGKERVYAPSELRRISGKPFEITQTIAIGRAQGDLRVSCYGVKGKEFKRTLVTSISKSDKEFSYFDRFVSGGGL